MNTPVMGPQLKPEGGVTRHSLHNGQILKAAHGAVKSVHCLYNPSDVWYRVEVIYQDGFQFTFSGFSWGYDGEGPRGLAEWAADNGVPLDVAAIRRLDNNTRGTKYLGTWGNGQWEASCVA